MEEERQPAGVPGDERIAASDMAYHTRTIDRFLDAQRALMRADAALSSWNAHLNEVYGLGPQDAVTPEGRIRRGALGNVSAFPGGTVELPPEEIAALESGEG